MSFDGKVESKETLALLELLALGNDDIEAGRTRPAREVMARLRGSRAAR